MYLLVLHTSLKNGLRKFLQKLLFSGLKFQTENDPSYGKTWMYFLDENNVPQKVYLEVPYSRLTTFALEQDEIAQLVNFTLYTR